MKKTLHFILMAGFALGTIGFATGCASSHTREIVYIEEEPEEEPTPAPRRPRPRPQQAEDFRAVERPDTYSY